MKYVNIGLSAICLTILLSNSAFAKQFICQPTKRIDTSPKGVHVSDVRKRDIFILDSDTGAFSTNWDGGSSWATNLRLDPKNSLETYVMGYRVGEDISKSNIIFRISIFPSVSKEITFTYHLGGTGYFGFCS